MDALIKIWWVGLGGFLGANVRYWLGHWADQRFGTQFPWGTFIINVTGSFILGLFMAVAAERILPAPWRLVFAIGFVGAYTTFSTFEYETFKLANSGSTLWALANVLFSVLAGFIAVWIGAKLGEVRM